MSKTRPNIRRSSKGRLFSRSWWRRSENWTVIAITGMALAVVTIVMLIQMPPTADIDQAAIATAELSDPRMKEIEDQFRCPCGNCGHLELRDCVCDVPGGAMEMKTAIARLLSEGVSGEAIIATIAADFGGLKPKAAANRLPHSDTRLTGDTEVVSDHDLHSAHSGGVDPNAILRVVSQFDCPCGNCKLTLLECTCDRDNGSVEVKAFIEENLEKGLSESTVVDAVITTFDAKRQLAIGTAATNQPSVIK